MTALSRPGSDADESPLNSPKAKPTHEVQHTAFSMQLLDEPSGTTPLPEVDHTASMYETGMVKLPKINAAVDSGSFVLREPNFSNSFKMTSNKYLNHRVDTYTVGNSPSQPPFPASGMKSPECKSVKVRKLSKINDYRNRIGNVAKVYMSQDVNQL